jgi:formate hydrogenlyase transcriptional activator
MTDHVQPVGEAGPLTRAPSALAIDDRVRFESLLADLSARFVNLPAAQVDDAIQEAQRRIVEELAVDRSVLFIADGDGTFRYTHVWSAIEWPLPPGRTAATDFFPWITAKVFRGETVSYTSVDELPSPDRESTVQFGTKSSIIIPLSVGGRVIGALTFGVMREERRWPPDLVTRLRLVAEVFANALARKQADQDLRHALAEVERLRDRLKNENAYLRRQVTTLQGSSLIVGASKALQTALDQASQVAPTPATVLLLGETGTGKELFASQIHDLSPRRNRLMVRVNCSAIPSALIESELFGREQGAYTGALSRQAGRFEVADKSTLFLDEIGDLPLEMQIKLLRVLQERQIERLGSSKPINVNVRIVAATNRDLEAGIAQGTFRKDLYYRLNVFPIRIPPLRERADDVPMLVWSFVDEFSRTFGKPIEAVSKVSMLALQRYHWPGNVRELRNVVERAVIVATGPRLTIDPPKTSATITPEHASIALLDIERDHIVAVLERAKWRVRGDGGAAELLAMKPSTLESRMTKLGIERPRN